VLAILVVLAAAAAAVYLVAERRGGDETTTFSPAVTLARGEEVTMIAGEDEPSTESTIVVDYPTLVADLEPGDQVSVGDGAVQLQIRTRNRESLDAVVTHGGHLVGRKGVKIPAARFHAQVPTDEDLEFLRHLRGASVDVVAVSFVRSASDMRAVREAVGDGGPWLMAKIETALAVENLSGIIDASDAVMVARGDLGNELPIEDVPHLQKRIIRETVRKGKPVLVATQMLESMIDAPTPTRAEVTDVANAVFDQASAVMLSAETAVGHDPVNVVRTMDRILKRAEQQLNPAQLQLFALENRDLSDVNVATAHAAWTAANDINARAILCCTRTGATARKMSSFRPLTPLYGMSADPRALRQLALCWGVQPLFLAEAATSTQGVMRAALEAARAAGIVQTGDQVVVLAGSPQAGPGHTNALEVARVD
jgi:pyruvate kinase